VHNFCLRCVLLRSGDVPKLQTERIVPEGAFADPVSADAATLIFKRLEPARLALFRYRRYVMCDHVRRS
jgi:hypothetical protein